MAVKFGASGRRWVRSSGIPDHKLFTYVATVYVDSWRDSAYQYGMGFESSGGANWLLVGRNQGNSTLHVTDTSNGVFTSALPSAGAWYWFFLRSNGTNFRGGFRPISGGSWDIVQSAVSWDTQQEAANMYAGGDGLDSEWADWTMAHIKVWDAALSDEEIEAECQQAVPIRLADLHMWTPVVDTGSSRVNDYSGNGRNWTEVGTGHTDVAGPNIPWSQGRSFQRRTTTGILDDISVKELDGPALIYFNDATEVFQFDNLPVGKGLIIEIRAGGPETVPVVSTASLSIDGLPQFTSNSSYNSTFLAYPNITEAKQTLTIVLGEHEANSQGKAYLYEISGHDLVKMIGWTVSTTDRYLTIAPETPGGLVIGSARYNIIEPVCGGGQWYERYTPAYNATYTYYNPRCNGGVMSNWGGDFDGWQWIEIRRGEKQRRSRIITVREPYTAQPQGPVEIDWNNPITREMVYAVLPYATYQVMEVITGEFLQRGYSTWSPVYNCSDGKAISTISYDRLEVYPSSRFYLSGIGEIFTRFKTTSLQSRTITSLSNSLGMFQQNTADTMYVSLYGTDAGSQYFEAVGTTPLGNSFVNSSVFSEPSSNTSQVWLNGKLEAETSSTIYSGSGPHRLEAPSYDYGTDSALISFVLVWQRRLSDAERVELHRNPWQILKPKTDKRIFTGSPVITHKRRRIL